MEDLEERRRKYQVWVGGKILYDVEAASEAEARSIVRDFLGCRRLPKDTAVLEISWDYYLKIAENNVRIGASFEYS